MYTGISLLSARIVSGNFSVKIRKIAPRWVHLLYQASYESFVAFKLELCIIDETFNEFYFFFPIVGLFLCIRDFHKINRWT